MSKTPGGPQAVPTPYPNVAQVSASDTTKVTKVMIGQNHMEIVPIKMTSKMDINKFSGRKDENDKSSEDEGGEGFHF